MVDKIEEKREAKAERLVEVKIKSKKELILESKMPEAQKKALLVEIGELEVEQEVGVEFIVYAKIKKLSSALTKALLASSKVKNVRLASIEKWDEILKDF